VGRLARSRLSTNNRNSSRQGRKGELERSHAKAAKDANPTTFRRRVTWKGARGGRVGRCEGGFKVGSLGRDGTWIEWEKKSGKGGIVGVAFGA